MHNMPARVAFDVGLSTVERQNNADNAANAGDPLEITTITPDAPDVQRCWTTSQNSLEQENNRRYFEDHRVVVPRPDPDEPDNSDIYEDQQVVFPV
jgi:hypothetical protein